MEPIATAHLYAPLHRELILLLENLASDDWGKPTVCRSWAVRDIAAHLLDVDIRRLSLSRDNLQLPPPDPPIDSYSSLVAFLNRLNADWVTAARRMSPRVLVALLGLTGEQTAAHVTALDMQAPSRFSVAWAGEEVSLNWFAVARDYTERWHHQQQIRDAVGAEPLTGARWLSPVLATFMRALPHHYRNVFAQPGAAIEFRIEGEAGGTWTLLRTADAWRLQLDAVPSPAATVRLDDDTAWRHFTKGLSLEDSRRRIQTEGDAGLGEPFLTCLAIMA
jgi:uncharacterized protein (TIGR03083 family)